MDTQQNNEQQNTKNLKEIPKWTQRYTENRTLPFLVSMIAFALLFSSTGGLFYIAGNAYRSGNQFLCWICIIAAVLVFTAITLPVSFIERRLYRKEGQVTLVIPEKTTRQRHAGWIAGLLLGICVTILIVLIVICDIPIKYMQPLSAICFIPLILAIGIWQPPSIKPVGFLVLLWPTLYVIHAVLIVAGVPIHFDRPLIFLNILIPTAGYGILCALIGHIYGRYALKKLKSISHLEEETANEV